jgi:hypothetical protein
MTTAKKSKVVKVVGTAGTEEADANAKAQAPAWRHPGMVKAMADHAAEAKSVCQNC